MPLELLLVLVVGGIAAIAVLLHLLGKSARLVLTPDTAGDAWLRHFPDDSVTGVTLARNGHAALVETPSGPGLVWAFGADSAARRLQGAHATETAGALRVRFADFTAPAVTLRLDNDERARWRNRMDPK